MPISISINAEASGNWNINLSNYEVTLKDINVDLALSASGSYTLPTPWGVKIGPISIGFTVTLSAAADFKLNMVMTPTNNPSEELFNTLPVTINNVEGTVFVPFAVTGTIGAGANNGGSGLGIWGWLQGIIGVGEVLQRESASAA